VRRLLPLLVVVVASLGVSTGAASADNCDLKLNPEDCANTGWVVAGSAGVLAAGTAVLVTQVLQGKPFTPRDSGECGAELAHLDGVLNSALTDLREAVDARTKLRMEQLEKEVQAGEVRVQIAHARSFIAHLKAEAATAVFTTVLGAAFWAVAAKALILTGSTAGLDATAPRGAIYLWVPVPEGETSAAAQRLFMTSALAALSALLPRQPFVAPPGPGSPVMVLVEFALESVQHVVDFGEACFFERAAGIERAVAAAADQNDGAIDTGRFLYMCDKIRVDFPIRAVVPRHQDRARGMTHEQVLHLAAAVDEDGIRILPEKFVGFLGLEVFHRKCS